MKIILVILLISISNISFAGYFKGNQLKEHCFRDGMYHEGLCLGYIMGIYDGIILMEKTWQEGSHTICLPKNTKSGELKKVVVKLLNEDEVENIRNDASDIVWQALLIKYPCK
jgi:hypothetical protein